MISKVLPVMACVVGYGTEGERGEKRKIAGSVKTRQEETVMVIKNAKREKERKRKRTQQKENE